MSKSKLLAVHKQKLRIFSAGFFLWLIVVLLLLTACRSSIQIKGFVEIDARATLWLAYQKDKGSWQSLQPISQRVSLNNSYYAVAWVCKSDSKKLLELTVYVEYRTIKDSNTITAHCSSEILTEEVILLGTVTGLSKNEYARISFAESFTEVKTNDSFKLVASKSKSLNILATLYLAEAILPDRFLWLQKNTFDDKELQIDFKDSLPLKSYQIDLSALKAEESIYARVRMKAGDTHTPLSKILDITTDLDSITGLPYKGLNTLPEGIFHEVYLRTFSKNNNFRTITRHVHNARNFIMDLPPVLPQAALNREQTGEQGRLVARWQQEQTKLTTLGTQIVTVQLSESMNRYFYFNYSANYSKEHLQNKNGYEVTLPNFSEVAAWDSEWNFNTYNSLYWFLQLNQSIGTYGQDGYMITQSRKQGTIDLR